ncbi:hypothetical protein CYY_003129 [Polysphondylium violaceum]|uniref:non-specific serine/threonine protein kinase n=1 Tax=Polysphondylium violaceum TaxID=133409 RepID=A0A8J4UUK7_9MYCE|nr:hypothetical protein CYY_003129 [Polysphondylium violaceum]
MEGPLSITTKKQTRLDNNIINNNNSNNNSNIDNNNITNGGSTAEITKKATENNKNSNNNSPEKSHKQEESPPSKNASGDRIYTMDTSLTFDNTTKKRKTIGSNQSSGDDSLDIENDRPIYHRNKRPSISINISPSPTTDELNKLTLNSNSNLVEFNNNINNKNNSNNSNSSTSSSNISLDISNNSINNNHTTTTTTTTTTTSTTFNNQQQNPNEEIEEINRERLERDKMLHEENDIDPYTTFKYGDGEEGEAFDSLPLHHDHEKLTDVSQNNSPSRNHGNNNDDDDNHHHDHHCEEDDHCNKDHDNNSDHTYDHQSTDDDTAKSDMEKDGSESARNSNETLKDEIHMDDNDNDGHNSPQHNHHGKDESTVSTPQHQYMMEDDDESDEEDDVPLRIQTAANTKQPKLSLTNCWLKIIPADVFSLLELRDLDLSANHLKKVSKSIGSLVHLKRLRLNHNQLTTLPKELYNLPRLTTLYLNNNNFKIVPKEISKISTLKLLDLSFNQITDISPQTNINQMTNLVELRLRYNQLSSLPSNMMEATHLQVLWLEGNRLPLNKQVLKKSPAEIFTFLKQYKPPTKKVHEKHPKIGLDLQKSPPSIDAASTIAVAQVFAQKEMDTKKRKKENLVDIKKQQIEAEMKLKQLEEELLIANAKATKFEEEAAVLQQHFNNQPTPPTGTGATGQQQVPPTQVVANLPQILLNQPHLWDQQQNPNSPPNLITPPTSISPVLNGQQMVNSLSQISLLSPTANNPPSPIPPHLIQTNVQQSSPTHQQQQMHQIPVQQQQVQQIIIPNPQQQLIDHQFAVPISPAQQHKQNTEDKPFEWEVPLSEITLGARIGRGGYGQVFRGNWRGTEVAVKMLFNDNVNLKLIIDLRKEVDLLCKLRHPNIVLFMGACTEPASPCIVTEFLSRGSLANILLDETIDMDWGLRLQLGFDCARGMTYLHSRNPIIIHRDLKTDNLLVDDSWQVKVGDFGLATVKSHTFAKTMCGTTGWVAPEVLAEEGYTEKADVYSFAIVLWELLTRLIPYAGKNTMQVVRSIDRGERLPMPDWCPPAYAKLINRCWDTDPTNRPSFPEILPIMENMISEFQIGKKEAIAAGKPIPYVGPLDKDPSIVIQKQIELQHQQQQQIQQQQQQQIQQLQLQLQQQQQQINQQQINQINHINQFNQAAAANQSHIQVQLLQPSSLVKQVVQLPIQPENNLNNNSNNNNNNNNNNINNNENNNNNAFYHKPSP